MQWNEAELFHKNAQLTVELLVDSRFGKLHEIVGRVLIQELTINQLLFCARSNEYFIVLCAEKSHKMVDILYPRDSGTIYLKSMNPSVLRLGDVLLLPEIDPKQIRPHSYD